MTGKTLFQPGKSGNPGGTTSEQKARIRAAKDKALEHCNEAIAELVRLMQSTDERIRLGAANAILDRGLGKPAQALIGDADADPINLLQKVERVIVRPNVKD